MKPLFFRVSSSFISLNNDGKPNLTEILLVLKLDDTLLIGVTRPKIRLHNFKHYV